MFSLYSVRSTTCQYMEMPKGTFKSYKITKLKTCVFELCTGTFLCAQVFELPGRIIFASYHIIHETIDYPISYFKFYCSKKVIFLFMYIYHSSIEFFFYLNISERRKIYQKSVKKTTFNTIIRRKSEPNRLLRSIHAIRDVENYITGW